ncbi:25118_t:CDS:2, partial [Gigaspora margarita]
MILLWNFKISGIWNAHIHQIIRRDFKSPGIWNTLVHEIIVEIVFHKRTLGNPKERPKKIESSTASFLYSTTILFRDSQK